MSVHSLIRDSLFLAFPQWVLWAFVVFLQVRYGIRFQVHFHVDHVYPPFLESMSARYYSRIIHKIILKCDLVAKYFIRVQWWERWHFQSSWSGHGRMQGMTGGGGLWFNAIKQEWNGNRDNRVKYLLYRNWGRQDHCPEYYGGIAKIPRPPQQTATAGGGGRPGWWWGRKLSAFWDMTRPVCCPCWRPPIMVSTPGWLEKSTGSS